MTNGKAPQPPGAPGAAAPHSSSTTAREPAYSLDLTEEVLELRAEADRLQRYLRRRFSVIFGVWSLSWLVLLIAVKPLWAAWMLMSGTTALALAASKYLRRRDTARLRSRLAVLTPEQRSAVLEPLVPDTRDCDELKTLFHDLIKDLETPPDDVIPSQSPEGSGSEVAPGDRSQLCA